MAVAHLVIIRGELSVVGRAQPCRAGLVVCERYVVCLRELHVAVHQHPAPRVPREGGRAQVQLQGGQRGAGLHVPHPACTGVSLGSPLCTWCCKGSAVGCCVPGHRLSAAALAVPWQNWGAGDDRAFMFHTLRLWTSAGDRTCSLRARADDAGSMRVAEAILCVAAAGKLFKPGACMDLRCMPRPCASAEQRVNTECKVLIVAETQTRWPHQACCS